MPHRIIIAPIAVLHALLAALCGIEATATVATAAGIFAVLAYAFVPPVRTRTDPHIVGSRHRG